MRTNTDAGFRNQKVAKCIMSRICKRFKETEDVYRQQGFSIKRATEGFQIHYMTLITKINKQMTSAQVAN